MLWTDQVYALGFLGCFLVFFGIVFSFLRLCGVSDVSWMRVAVMALGSIALGASILALVYDMGASA